MHLDMLYDDHNLWIAFPSQVVSQLYCCTIHKLTAYQVSVYHGRTVYIS